MMSVRILELPGPRIASHLPELSALYAAIYETTPGVEAEFGTLLQEHSQREGFRFYVAMVVESNEFIGLAYGFTGQPGQPWRDSLADNLGVEKAVHWLIGHFEFAEFGVLPGMRRRGIGTRLYDTLFSDLAQHHAILTVRASNQIAYHFYLRRGWQVLHDHFIAPSGRGPYLIMGLELTPPRPAGMWL